MTFKKKIMSLLFPLRSITPTVKYCIYLLDMLARHELFIRLFGKLKDICVFTSEWQTKKKTNLGEANAFT